MHLTDILLDRSISNEPIIIVVDERTQEFLRACLNNRDKIFSRTKACCPLTIGILTIFVPRSLDATYNPKIVDSLRVDFLSVKVNQKRILSEFNLC